MIRKYLQNRLPENQGLDYLIEFLAVSKLNIFALIGGIGVDASGAVMFVHEFTSNQIETTFRPIEDKELIMRLSNPTLWAMEIWDERPRLSVAGVQSKINVLKMNGQLGLGEGDLCSTHIIKFERNDQQHLVINEFVTMRLARLVGLETANVELQYFDKYPALLVERFDRKLTNDSVKRRHVIDGCQVCNMGVERKYERNLGKQRDVKHIRDGVSLIKLFQIIKEGEGWEEINWFNPATFLCLSQAWTSNATFFFCSMFCCAREMRLFVLLKCFGIVDHYCLNFLIISV